MLSTFVSVIVVCGVAGVVYRKVLTCSSLWLVIEFNTVAATIYVYMYIIRYTFLLLWVAPLKICNVLILLNCIKNILSFALSSHILT